MAATAVHVGLSIRLRIVAAMKNSRPRAAWSDIRRAALSLPPAPLLSVAARRMPRKITRLPASSENIRAASTTAWY